MSGGNLKSAKVAQGALQRAPLATRVPMKYYIIHMYHDAARARGLITGDEEYSICMQEASGFQVGSQLRSLFVTLILDGAPAAKLWSDFQTVCSRTSRRT